MEQQELIARDARSQLIPFDKVLNIDCENSGVFVKDKCSLVLIKNKKKDQEGIFSHKSSDEFICTDFLNILPINKSLNESFCSTTTEEYDYCEEENLMFTMGDELTCIKLSETQKKQLLNNINNDPVKMNKVNLISNVIVKTPVKSSGVVRLSKTDKKSMKTPSTEKKKQTNLFNYFSVQKPSQTSSSGAQKVAKRLFSTPKKNVPQDVKKLKSSVSPKKEKRSEDGDSSRRIIEDMNSVRKWVLDQKNFEVLFSRDEKDFMRLLSSLPEDVQLICYRLHTHQYKWYNLHQFCIKLDIDCKGHRLKMIKDELSGARLVDDDYSCEPLEALLNLLRLPDLKDIGRVLRQKPHKTKSELMSALLQNSAVQTTLSKLNGRDLLLEQVRHKLGVCVRISQRLLNLLDKLHLLYSLANPDLHKAADLYRLLAIERSGSLVLHTVPLADVQLFANRTEFKEYMQAHRLLQEVYLCHEKKQVLSMLHLCREAQQRLRELLANADRLRADRSKPLHWRRFTTSWLYCSVLYQGAQFLAKHYPSDVCEWLETMLGQNVYQVHRRGPWYTQLCMVRQSHQGNAPETVRLIQRGLADPAVSDVSRYELNERGLKVKHSSLSKLEFDNLQLSLVPDIIESFPSQKVRARELHSEHAKGRKTYLKLTTDGTEYSSVEQTAIDHYKDTRQFTAGVHCEGRLINALFFMFFWDIMYQAHATNTFITRIQSYPLDLHYGGFRDRYLPKISNRLNQIRAGWSPDQMYQFALKVWRDNPTFDKFSSCSFLTETNLREILDCMGRDVLIAMLERLLNNYKLYRSGLPDLFLWNIHTHKCAFVEVKSNNDKLSSKQILWLDYLRSNNASIEICEVNSIGAKIVNKKHCE